MTLTSIQDKTDAKPVLTEAELMILSSAANRADRVAIPVPATLSCKPGHVQSALKPLLRRKLLEEHPAKLEDGLWRKDDEDRHLTLRITPAGYEAIKVEVPVDLEPARLSTDKATNKPTQNRQKRYRREQAGGGARPAAHLLYEEVRTFAGRAEDRLGSQRSAPKSRWQVCEGSGTRVRAARN